MNRPNVCTSNNLSTVPDSTLIMTISCFQSHPTSHNTTIFLITNTTVPKSLTLD